MLVLIILVICLTVISAFLADKKLDSYFLDFDYIYSQFLEEEIKQIEKKEKFILETIKTKKIIININIKNMIKIEQKLKTYKKIINNKESSSYDVWKAEGLSIKLKEEWKERYSHNKRLIAEINKLK